MGWMIGPAQVIEFAGFWPLERDFLANRFGAVAVGGLLERCLEFVQGGSRLARFQRGVPQATPVHRAGLMDPAPHERFRLLALR